MLAMNLAHMELRSLSAIIVCLFSFESFVSHHLVFCDIKKSQLLAMELLVDIHGVPCVYHCV